MSPKLRIFLADDHAVVRAGLKALILSEPGLHVVGEAADGEETVARAPKLKPDVVVLDISMPKLSGIETAERLRQECPETKIVGLSMHEDRGYLRELLAAGATGYALKRSGPEELLRAIRAVAAGAIYVDPAVVGDLLQSLVEPGLCTLRPGSLSEREQDVLRLLAEGHSIRAIAAEFTLSVKTIETYKARAMEKLGLKNRVDIIRYARHCGWFNN